MKTSKQPLFPTLENEFVENILRQTIGQYPLIQIFCNKTKPAQASQLVIHLKQKQDADELQLRPWIEKVKRIYKIHVYCVYSTRLHHKFSMGHPFVEAYCGPLAEIYRDEAAGNLLVIGRRWTKYKKKFHDFEERFYNAHEGQLEQLQKLIAEGVVNSVFTAYERLINYDLDCLEDLYAGHASASHCLNERINGLASSVPDIQKYFVRKNSHAFYLTTLFTKAQKGINEDEVIFDDDLFEAVGITENGLYNLIEERLAALKKLVKKRSVKQQGSDTDADDLKRDVSIEMAVAAILNSVEAEQVYWFHQTTYGEKKTYYLLLIARGVGNEKLKSLTQSLKSKAGVGFDFVLVAHERYWIQQNLFQYQQFFMRIVQRDNLVYSSSVYHPEFHWIKPHQPYHADLYLYYTATSKTALQFFVMANADEQNHQGLAMLFTLFFVSFCRTFISAKTYYAPNALSNQALWQLCLYADTGMHRYNYLTEQFPGGLFGFLDKHSTPHHRLYNHSKTEVDQMMAIVKTLMEALHGLVVEQKLLGDREVVWLSPKADSLQA